MQFIGIFLDRKAKDPLYMQLYRYIIQQIRDEVLVEGEKLPGKRTAASQLGVSVNTIETAYSMLASEGYIESIPRSGFRVSPVGGHVSFGKSVSPRRLHTPKEQKASNWSYDLSSGGIDPTLFPRKIWNRLLREVLSDHDDLFTLGLPQGELELRQAIAEYLQGYRGVRCTPEQIQIGAGLELLTAQLARLFAASPVAVENPGYRKSVTIFRNEGLSVEPISVDSQGMSVAQLHESHAKVAYVTPSHQFPCAVVMPVGRRDELLDWAAQGNHIIIEDDYDSEYRFESKPIPSLQGLDQHQSVIYAGTFSRSLSPGLRVAYLVLPPWLISEWKERYGTYACTVSRPEQQTLARFIQQGHFGRSINRNRIAYRKKRDMAIEALETLLPANSYTISNEHTGLYFLLRLKGVDHTKFAQWCRGANLRVHAISEYLLYEDPNVNDALMIGYGALRDSEHNSAFTQLSDLYTAYRQT